SRPQILRASRKRRIAAGAGVQVQEVNRMLKQFEQMQGMMKKMKGGGMARMMRALGGGMGGGLGGLLGGGGGGMPGMPGMPGGGMPGGGVDAVEIRAANVVVANCWGVALPVLTSKVPRKRCSGTFLFRRCCFAALQYLFFDYPPPTATTISIRSWARIVVSACALLGMISPFNSTATRLSAKSSVSSRARSV